jgi:hypothetical protein
LYDFGQLLQIRKNNETCVPQFYKKNSRIIRKIQKAFSFQLFQKSRIVLRLAETHLAEKN